MIPILMYHQVAEIPRSRDPLGLAVSPDQFARQMSYLARGGYACLTLAELVQRLKDGSRPPARSFVLTFDDGYQDFGAQACPILERFGFTATVFLVAGRMGLPSDWEGQAGARSGQLLSWAEAAEVARHGHILGSHTLSHPHLISLADQPAFEEICRSRVLLQNRLDMPIHFFSYPYSGSDARIERLVAEAGYTAACAGNLGPWGRFHLWRVPCLAGDTPLSFALKASGLYQYVSALRESAPGRLARLGVHGVRRVVAARNPARPASTGPTPDKQARRGR